MHKRLWILGLVATSLVLAGCPEKRRPAGAPGAKPTQAAPVPKPAGGEKSTTTGPLADYAHTLDKTEKKAAEVTGLSMLNQGVQQFNVVEGRFPRTLDELVEARFLSKIPVAPRGKRFIYNPKSGEVTVADLAPETPAPAVESEQPPVSVPVAPAPAPSEADKPAE